MEVETQTEYILKLNDEEMEALGALFKALDTDTIRTLVTSKQAQILDDIIFVTPFPK